MCVCVISAKRDLINSWVVSFIGDFTLFEERKNTTPYEECFELEKYVSTVLVATLRKRGETRPLDFLLSFFFFFFLIFCVKNMI